MSSSPDPAALDKLKSRIQALRAKTMENGCTEDEALLAAAKVAELLDRYDLSLSDVEMRQAPCDRLEYETWRKKRVPIDGCVTAIADFCACRAWREKNQWGEARYVYFGLRSDIAVAHYLTELIDNAVRFELGRYKSSLEYLRFRHKDRAMANASFALGMVTSIAEKLTAMKAERDAASKSTGRDLVVLKTGIVDAELKKLDLNLSSVRSGKRMVSTSAFDAGSSAGAALALHPGVAEGSGRRLGGRGS